MYINAIGYDLHSEGIDHTCFHEAIENTFPVRIRERDNLWLIKTPLNNDEAIALLEPLVEHPNKLYAAAVQVPTKIHQQFDTIEAHLS